MPLRTVRWSWLGRPVAGFLGEQRGQPHSTADWTIIGDTKEVTIHGSHLGPYCYPQGDRRVGDGDGGRETAAC